MISRGSLLPRCSEYPSLSDHPQCGRLSPLKPCTHAMPSEDNTAKRMPRLGSRIKISAWISLASEWNEPHRCVCARSRPESKRSAVRAIEATRDVVPGLQTQPIASFCVWDERRSEENTGQARCPVLTRAVALIICWHISCLFAASTKGRRETVVC